MQSPHTIKCAAHYLPHIDGLRGISVLAILLFHLDVMFFGGGFVGVDVFFIISGFLITQLIAREIEDGTFSFANFYARRIKRIFPALFVMLFVTSLAAILFLGAREYSQFFQALRAASGQISNILFSREIDYFAIGNKNNPLLHTWSLGVEEQFYLIWPLVLFFTHKLWGIGRAAIVLSILLLISLGVSEYMVRTNAIDAFYLLHSRGWELALGGLIGLGAIPPLRKQWGIEIASLIGCALIALSVLFYHESGFPGLKAIIPCMGAALFIYSAQHGKGIAHKIISSRALVFTGLISYSLYLWHWPLIAFYKSYFSPDLSATVQISITILSFALAWLSYKFVETPFRRMTLPPKRVIGLGFAAIVVFVVSSNLIKDENEAGWRVTYKADKAIIRANNYYKTCAVDGGAFNRDDCIIGPNKDKYEVILAGDSHAAHYIPTVLEWAKSKDLTVRIFLRGACRTFVQTDAEIIRQGKVDTYCMDLTKAFYDTLDQDKSIQYVFLGLMLATGTDEVKASLKKIDDRHKKTYFLGSVPIFENDPHQCHIKNNLLVSKVFPRPAQNCMDIDPVYSNAKIAESHDSLKPVLADLGIPYFDPLPFMQTPYDKEGHFMFMDTDHLNQYGGMHLWPYLDQFIAKNPVTTN